MIYKHKNPELWSPAEGVYGRWGWAAGKMSIQDVLNPRLSLQEQTPWNSVRTALLQAIILQRRGRLGMHNIPADPMVNSGSFFRINQNEGSFYSQARSHLGFLEHKMFISKSAGEPPFPVPSLVLSLLGQKHLMAKHIK